MAQPKTLYDKIYDDHFVGEDLIYIDRHLIHEVTSPQAFEGIRMAGRKVRRPEACLAVADRSVQRLVYLGCCQCRTHLALQCGSTHSQDTLFAN